MATATNLWHEAQLTFKGNPSIYSLKGGSETFLNEAKKIRKCEIGTEVKDHFNEKVIMFVGETGSGKTTMINTIANYFLGIEWEDGKRYKLIGDREEEKKESQTRSNTEWITYYTFHQPKTLPYKVTLVDTPGFGDTSGKEMDKLLTGQILEFFTIKGGIDHIDAVAFVVKASSVRLTPAQKYIFDSVLRLFGENIGDNIFLFITHAEATQMDNEEAPVIQAAKADQIPMRGVCVCNNNVLFYQIDNRKTKLAKSNNMHYEVMWESMTNNLTKFFNELGNCTPKSLTLSAKVLEERRNLEITVARLPDLIKSSLVKMNILRKEEKVLEKYREEMKSNRNFEYEVNEEVIMKITLDDGTLATVCNVCERTCHFPCKKDIFIDLMGIRSCSAMRAFPNFRGCGVCLNNCPVDDHSLEPMRYDRKIQKVTKTREKMKQRYDIAKMNMNNAEAFVSECKLKQEAAQQEIDKCVGRLRKCLERLNKIALRSDPNALVDHLRFLKHNESHKMEPGWEDRVKELHKILQAEKQTVKNKLVVKKEVVETRVPNYLKAGISTISNPIKWMQGRRQDPSDKEANHPNGRGSNPNSRRGR
ncbi:hypothetical protein HOLleu_05831 [Holothuria leucospilota]|uniref:Septin-type G domain-containing protein n=1 Tax=Holothuria leucospilota TaxID=206669 RepID=A0A9Q1CKE2_HOLLE|nr:hypothetical protein HOLleu_05831 [Holothuria leucospilota]